MNLSEYSEFILLLAEKSANIIRGHFFNPKLFVETKPDDSPVSQADKEAEELMRGMIQKKYPSHGIIGEEFGSENESAEFVWTMDPIDGTVSFISGVPLFGTMIGLLQQGKPILGLIHQPILNLLCLGDNKITTVNGKQVNFRKIKNLSQAFVLTSDIKNIEKYKNKSAFDALIKSTRIFRTWGDAYGYLMVASGWADIIIDPIISIWETGSIIPIINGAKGIISSWNGGDALNEGSSVVANEYIHEQVINILNVEEFS